MSSPTQQASQDPQAQKESSKHSTREVCIRLPAKVHRSLESTDVMLICHFRDKHGLMVSFMYGKGSGRGGIKELCYPGIPFYSIMSHLTHYFVLK